MLGQIRLRKVRLGREKGGNSKNFVRHRSRTEHPAPTRCRVIYQRELQMIASTMSSGKAADSNGISQRSS